MKYNIMKKWVKALRSGEYKQGKLALHRIESDAYCCLGVLCELAVKENIVKKSSECSSSTSEYDELAGSLPESVVDWAGMKSASGSRKNRRNSLMVLNDDSNFSFKRIADVIEKEYKDL